MLNGILDFEGHSNIHIGLDQGVVSKNLEAGLRADLRVAGSYRVGPHHNHPHQSRTHWYYIPENIKN